MRREDMRRLKVLFLILAGALLLLLPFLTSYRSLASEMLIFAIFAIGYDIAFGYTGLLSFAHAMFFGTGAYGTALVLIRWVPSLFLGLGVGMVASLLVSFVVGILSIRRKGIYFVMTTLAFCQMLFFIAFKWKDLTGGDDGLHGLERPSFGFINLNSEYAFYYVVLFFFFLSFLAARRIVGSPFGKVLSALKDNEERARSIGYKTRNFKLISFMLSALFSGLAGGLYALHLNFVPIESLSIATSGDVLIMALMGGVGTLYGPIFGAMLTVYLKNILNAWSANWNLAMGVIFILTVLIFRQGIFPVLRDAIWRKG
jgi:branched-chain amino acid transport system permease protein